MAEHVVLLSIPGLREKDVAAMENFRSLVAGGETADLVPGFPCVTCPVQAAMTTGKPARGHGVVANGFYWRENRKVEMWTSPNDCIERPQIWDLLHERDPRGNDGRFGRHHGGDALKDLKEFNLRHVRPPNPVRRFEPRHGLFASESRQRST